MEQMVTKMLEQAKHEYEQVKEENPNDHGNLMFLLGKIDSLQSVLIKILYLKNFNQLTEN